MPLTFLVPKHPPKHNKTLPTFTDIWNTVRNYGTLMTPMPLQYSYFPEEYNLLGTCCHAVCYIYCHFRRTCCWRLKKRVPVTHWYASSTLPREPQNSPVSLLSLYTTSVCAKYQDQWHKACPHSNSRQWRITSTGPGWHTYNSITFQKEIKTYCLT